MKPTKPELHGDDDAATKLEAVAKFEAATKDDEGRNRSWWSTVLSVWAPKIGRLYVVERKIYHEHKLRNYTDKLIEKKAAEYYLVKLKIVQFKKEMTEITAAKLEAAKITAAELEAAEITAAKLETAEITAAKLEKDYVKLYKVRMIIAAELEAAKNEYWLLFK